MRIIVGLFVLVWSLSLLTGTLAQGVGSILTKPLFEQMLKRRNDANCPANGFYTYEAFVQAANSYPAFGTTGDTKLLCSKPTVALCSRQEVLCNYNYGPAGQAIGANLLGNPDLVANDPVISFKTALWFWMTPQSPKPSSHDVITGRWTPSATDNAARRVPGYGVITNIINGGIECGKGSITAQQQDRIGFYKGYCDILGVGYGSNLDCANQRPFA